MSEHIESAPVLSEESPATEASQPGALSPEQIKSIKENFVNRLRQAYWNFRKDVMSIPANPVLANEAAKFYDTGNLWMREAIEACELKIQSAPEQPLLTPAADQQEAEKIDAA